MHSSNEDAIRELLLGRKVVSVDLAPDAGDDRYQPIEGTFTLDDGRVIEVIPNKGCSCSAGDYDLTSLERVDNIITRVDFDSPDEDEWGEATGSYTIFVLAGHEQINLLTVSGSDGNGYYGTGYTLRIR